MADENTSTSTEEEPPETGGEENADDTTTDEGTQGGSEEEGGEEFDKDRAMRTIKNLRKSEREGQKAQRELDKLRQKEKEREQAAKSETERLSDENADLKSQSEQHERDRHTWRVERALMVKADSVGITDLELALSVLDTDAVEFNDDGTSNIGDVLDDLVEKHPVLTAKPRGSRKKTGGSADAGKGSSDQGGPELTANELAMARAAGMTPEEYAKYKNPQDMGDHEGRSSSREGGDGDT